MQLHRGRVIPSCLTSPNYSRGLDHRGNKRYELTNSVRDNRGSDVEVITRRSILFKGDWTRLAGPSTGVGDGNPCLNLYPTGFTHGQAEQVHPHRGEGSDGRWKRFHQFTREIKLRKSMGHSQLYMTMAYVKLAGAYSYVVRI